jgi:hypothetical protein
MKRFIYDCICKIFGHKITDHITQPDNLIIDWCDRCGKYRSFIYDKKSLRAFDL